MRTIILLMTLAFSINSWSLGTLEKGRKAMTSCYYGEVRSYVDDFIGQPMNENGKFGPVDGLNRMLMRPSQSGLYVLNNSSLFFISRNGEESLKGAAAIDKLTDELIIYLNDYLEGYDLKPKDLIEDCRGISKKLDNWLGLKK